MVQFSLFGFPVTVRGSFWLGTAIFGGIFHVTSAMSFIGVAMFMLAALVSILIHELGHAFMIRRSGDVSTIELHALGGFATSLRRKGRWEQFRISAAGPLAQAIAGFLALWLLIPVVAPWPLLQTLVHSFGIISIMWAIFNCLPIIPLDGGRMMQCLLANRSWRLSEWISLVTAAAAAFYCLTQQSFFWLLFCGIFAWNSHQRLQGRDEVHL
jgi:stage IV sporulation protein FB